MTPRGPARGATLLRIAVALSLGGSTLAVAVPTFVRELSTSRLLEATDGVARLSAAAVAFSENERKLPAPCPLTPPAPPRGELVVDEPGTWEAEPWAPLAFRPVAEGRPHAYAFELETRDGLAVARARGDLDGDGVTSLFEARASAPKAGEPLRAEPGLYVEAELE